MLFAAALLLTLARTVVAELPPIYAKGTKFIFKNGTQFIIKGISYQEHVRPEGFVSSVLSLSDPLANEKACQRDVPILQELGVNAIRVYAIDSKANHDGCMKLLDDAGIYVFADISKPTSHIQGDVPRWDLQLYANYTRAASAIANYTNVAGLFIGNNVANSVNASRSLAYVKAAIRDVKVYLRKNHLRPVSIGYTTNDHNIIRSSAMQYLNCGDDDTAMTDFWGTHNFGWCGKASLVNSGYEDMNFFYNKTTIPVLLTEYGCGIPGGTESRTFDETRALYSDTMLKYGKFSGGFAYTYFHGDDAYGVVKVVNGRARKLASFAKLKQALEESEFQVTKVDLEEDVRRTWPCPSVGAQWLSHAALPPTPDEHLCHCVDAQAECFPLKNPANYTHNYLRINMCRVDPALCAGAESEPVRGHHGAYSMCEDRERITFQVDAYFKKNRYNYVQDKQPDSCYWDRQAYRKRPTAEKECYEPLRLAEERNKALEKQMVLDDVFYYDHERMPGLKKLPDYLSEKPSAESGSK